MARIDLRKLALRLKIIEILRTYAGHKCLQEAHAYWRRLICSN